MPVDLAIGCINYRSKFNEVISNVWLKGNPAISKVNCKNNSEILQTIRRSSSNNSRIIGSMQSDRKSTISRWLVVDGWTEQQEELIKHSFSIPLPDTIMAYYYSYAWYHQSNWRLEDSIIELVDDWNFVNHRAHAGRPLTLIGDPFKLLKNDPWYSKSRRDQSEYGQTFELFRLSKEFLGWLRSQPKKKRAGGEQKVHNYENRLIDNRLGSSGSDKPNACPNARKQQKS